MTSKRKRPEHIKPLADSIDSPQMDAFRQGSIKAGQTLCQQTEAIALEGSDTSTESLSPLSPESTEQILKNLQIHQAELKIQNEELLQTQVKLDAIQARYFDLYDLAPVGYCTINEKGQILEANLTAATLLGVARGELEGHSISEYILQEDQDIYYLHNKQLLASDSAHRRAPQKESTEHIDTAQAYDLRMLKKDGTTLWVQLKVTSVQVDSSRSTSFVKMDLKNRNKGVSEYRVMLSDITERKQSEAQRVVLEDQARQIEKADSLERMAGAIAHLFNNQLCVVLGNLEMTLEDMVGDALPRQNLVKAMQAARRSSEISSLLLTYLGQSKVKLEPLDLSAICRNNLPRFQTTKASNVTIMAELMPPGAVVSANANQIQQILTNLITNGLEAIGDRTGQVTVSTKNLPATDIPTSHIFPIDWQSKAENFVCLEVKDTGVGMSDQMMDKIFDPFFTTKFTGRGLGLAVVLGLVKRWGGMIGVESEVGKGSCFQILLPLVMEEIPPHAELLVEPWNFNTGWTVLLVDDDYIVRNVIEAVLKRLGITVFVAAGGQEAIDLFQQYHANIHCLITDMSMPDMDGWATLAALRKIQPDLPAILSSGYDETQAMRGDYAELPQAFLHKPFEINELKSVLSRVLGGPGLRTI